MDKGASVRKTHQLLEDEIKNRIMMLSFSRLKIAPDETVDKHVQYLCAKETNKEDERFKPFATLKHPTKHGKFDHGDVSAAVEPNWSHSPTKSIPLKESLKLQEEHVRKLKEEQAKRLVNELEMVEGTADEEEMEEKESVLSSEDVASVL